MYPALNSVKQKLSQIIHQLMGDIPSIRIAIIAHGDYCDYRSDYVMKKLDFSNDKQIILDFVNSIKEGGGGDSQENYEVFMLRFLFTHIFLASFIRSTNIKLVI